MKSLEISSKRQGLSLLVVAVLSLAWAAAAAQTTVFDNVRVLTMTGSGVVSGARVVVDGEKIISVGAAKGAIDADATVIDGAGKTLMPGLADMHVHYFNEDDGAVFLANSVTTVRNPWGTSQTLNMDAGAKNGSLMGPHIATSGPLMDGPKPIWGEGSMKITSPDQAVGAVESQRTTGYTAVKLYEGLTPEIYRAAVAAAKERNMQVWTHTPDGMSVNELLDLKVDSLEHFDNVDDVLLPEGATADGYFARWAAADSAKMAALASRSAESGMWHSPTMSVIQQRYVYGADPEGFFQRPESDYIGPGLMQWWQGSAQRIGPYTDERKAAAVKQKQFLKSLYDAGAPVLLGTDTPNPFVLPGFAIHDELALFVDSGIPVEDVLRIATADAAKFLRQEGEWGVVAADARADLVLLDADPREQLDTLRRPAGVMINGRWHNRSDLDGVMAELKARVAEAREKSAAAE